MDDSPSGRPAVDQQPAPAFAAGLPRYPGGPEPAPAKPGRRRPSAWWFAVTGAMLVAACALGAALIVGFVQGLSTMSDIEAAVDASGTPTVVRLAPHTSYVMWDQAAYRDECRVTDVRTGAPAMASSLGHSTLNRTDRSGTWYAARYLDSGSGHLEVTCAPQGGPVQFGARPDVGTVLGDTARTAALMFLLGTAGLVGFIVTLCLFIARRPRPLSN